MYIMYSSLFLAYISYCSEIWGNTYSTNVNCHVLLKKRATRLLYGAGRYDHKTSLFYRLHTLKFRDIIVKFKTVISCLCIKHTTACYHLINNNIL